MLILASTSLPRHYTDNLAPWDLTALQPWRDDYLAGFTAEGYTVPLADGHGMAREVMADVVAECRAVAAADGVTLPGDVDLAVRRIAETMPTQHSSTAQDLKRGKPTEIDHLNGYVVRRGEALGVPTPANRVLWTVVKLVESAPAGAA
mgnify:CR=1 FL=1